MAEQERDLGSRGTGDEATAQAIKGLAQPHVEKAIETLVEVMTDGERDGLRLAAARELLDRACGKAGRTEDRSLEDDNNRVDEILAEMRERARRLRGAHRSPPFCDREGEVPA